MGDGGAALADSDSGRADSEPRPLSRAPAGFPPSRLPELGEGAARWLRRLWYLALAAALALVVAGTVFVFRDAYHRDPIFNQLGFASAIEPDGGVSVTSILTGSDGRPFAPEGSRIVAIGAEAVPAGTDLFALTERLEAAPGPAPVIAVERPDGSRARMAITRTDRYRAEAEEGALLALDQRMALRWLIALSTCAVLIGCAILLATRRRRDPVCQLFSFAFLILAGCLDPALNMWLALGWGDVFDAVLTIGWMALVLGIAVFPDGRFEPRWTRWLLLLLPAAALPLSIETVPLAVQVAIAFVAPLALLFGLAIKYRRYEPGIERQQIKWGALGFASGLVSTTLAFVLMAAAPGSGTSYEIFTPLGVLFLFNLGFVLIALGLLVALIRFRLWEADRAISRSAIFGGLAVALGALWAASMDLLKKGVEYALGDENQMLATALGAVLAAGLFGPAQALLIKRTRNRFDGDRKRIETLVTRLAAWRAAETPTEIAQRALASLAGAIHCGSGAIMVDTALGREVLAARDLDDPLALADPGANVAGDPRFVWRYPLEDEDGPIGLLLVGPRSDQNRYNPDERENCERVLEPLATALRVALKRREQDGSVQRMLGMVEERLARLEGGGGSPAPA